MTPDELRVKKRYVDDVAARGIVNEGGMNQHVRITVEERDLLISIIRTASKAEKSNRTKGSGNKTKNYPHDAMSTDDELRVKFFESRGWKIEQVSVWEKDDDIIITNPNGKEAYDLPPLTLDECHEAEMELKAQYPERYFDYCWRLPGVSATASQRAEVFIAVMEGK